jgi:hypothetical protein
MTSVAANRLEHHMFYFQNTGSYSDCFEGEIVDIVVTLDLLLSIFMLLVVNHIEATYI